MPISPCHDLPKDVNSSVGEANRVMLLAIRVEGRLSSKRDLLGYVWLISATQTFTLDVFEGR